MRRNIVVGMVGKYVRGILAVYSVLVAVDMVLWRSVLVPVDAVDMILWRGSGVGMMVLEVVAVGSICGLLVLKRLDMCCIW